MFLKQILLGLGLCAGLVVAADHFATPLTVNNVDYEMRCGAGSDPNYPCFTFLGGDLNDVHVEITKGESLYPTTNLLVKDDQMRDFTIDDPLKKVWIYWRAFGVSLIYSPIDPSKAKSRIQIEAPTQGSSRIWVNDGLDGEGIDLDSDYTLLDGRDFTSKWLRIHVSNDRHQG